MNIIAYIRRYGTKKITALLLAVFLIEPLTPHIAWALTSGPTSPEATSFEPVDTTDMVNLQTGDFTYNMPLLEVPGPEGGYPLALSYHAGIMPEEDASWVGLGWSLSPGALVRNVNGYPDDWYNQKQTVRDYWSGGTQRTYSVGVSVGLPGPIANVGFGLDFSQDTYRGFGVGMSISGGVGYGPFQAGVRVGGSAYGELYAGLYAGAGISTAESGLNATVGFGVGLSTNGGVSAGFSGGIGYGLDPKNGQRPMQFSLLGASIGSGGNKPSLEVGGVSARFQNSAAGRIQTKGWGFSFGIPVWYGINLQLGYSKMRYWSDEIANVSTHGSLHGSGWTVTDNQAYDSYSLLDDQSGKNIVDRPDPTRVAGGTYPDFDVYSVNAQGLGGNIRPFQLQGEVLSQNRKTYNGDTPVPAVTYFSPGATNYAPEFRFVNDFSNSYRQDYPTNNPSLNLTAAVPTFDDDPQFGENGSDNTGYGGGNELAGSKHVVAYRWSQDMPIKPRNAKGYDRNFVKTIWTDADPNASTARSYLISGFSITNESGVTYHFGLPAYSYREETYQEKITDNSSNLSFNRHTRTEPYAYTWHLTAITGPDYVDRNNNKVVDDADWGYWVSFEYGRWTGNYVWRNPAEGYHRDEDNEFKSMAIGTKEVYYLNAIRTRSHIAIFEKEFRLDGKSSSDINYSKASSPGPKYNRHGEFSVLASHALKLNRIYLFNAADSAAINATAGGTQTPRHSSCSTCEFPQNVIDQVDIQTQGRATIEAKALRIIEFDYDNSLCKNTPNSYDINTVGNKYGKLTLKGLNTRGKGGANLIPPTTFEYDFDAQEAPAVNGTFNGSTLYVAGLQRFQTGDLLMTDDASQIFCGYVSAVTASGSGYNYAMKNGDIASNGTRPVRKTKNPPYHVDARDLWGFYKSDYNTQAIEANYNLGRQTTPVSAKNIDVWSLRTIKPPLGNEIGIEYESDSYSKSVFGNNMSLIINPSWVNNNTLDFTVTTNGYPIDQFLAINESYPAVLVVEYEDEDYYGNRTQGSRTVASTLTITQINGNVLRAVSSKPLNVPGPGTAPRYSLVTGNISSGGDNGNLYGGGIRVKSLSMDNIGGTITVTDYRYEGISEVTSGTTSYAPGILPAFNNTRLDVLETSSSHTGIKRQYRRALYHAFAQVYSLARELPPPAVMYEYVSVTNEIRNANGNVRHSEGNITYQFEVLRDNMVGRVIVGHQQSGTTQLRNQALKKILTAVGNIKRIMTYDVNGKLLNETRHHYLHDGLETEPLETFMASYESRLGQFNYQGLIKERVNEVKRVRIGSIDSTLSVFSAREELPCIQTGTTYTDHVTGFTTTTRNKAFDFYSGSVTEVLEEDSYGNKFLTERIPAYRKYPAMGLRIATNSNKHMLSQEAGSVTYKINSADAKTAVVAAIAQTWSNGLPILDPSGGVIIQNTTINGNVWRMADSYGWLPGGSTVDGMTPVANFSAFNWTNPASSNGNWQKTGAITRYNVYSKGIEATDINGNFAATKLGYKNSRVTVSGGANKYAEIAFSGAEDETISGTNSTEVHRGSGTVVTTAAHTGGNSLRLSTGQSGFEYSVAANDITPGRDYAAAVWVKPTSGTAHNAKLYYQVNGTTKGTSASSSSSAKVSGGWTLITLDIKGSDITSGSTVKVAVRNDHATAQVYADDFRFQPANAVSTAYVYDKTTGDLTHVLDNNNLFTQYKYDLVGRLTETFVERLGVSGSPFRVSEQQYHYAKPLYAGSTLVYARVEYDNVVEDYQESETFGSVAVTSADVVVRFYWDPACSAVAILPASLPYTIQEDVETNDGFWIDNQTNNYFFTANQGSSQSAHAYLAGAYLIELGSQYSNQWPYDLVTTLVSRNFSVAAADPTGSLQYFPLTTKPTWMN